MSINYPHAAGRLWATAQYLRDDLKRAMKQVDPNLDPYLYSCFKASLDQSEWVTGEFEEVFEEKEEPYPADRTVSGGRIKDGNTGEISEPTCTDIRDFPRDLGT